MMSVEVQIISAVWCKRCQTIKPEVEALCTMAGATLTKLDMDQLEEDGNPLFGEIKSLPTIRMKIAFPRSGGGHQSPSVRGAEIAEGPWTTYTAATLDAWKTAIVATASVAPVADDTDF
jgi:hypothetical protein